MRCPSELFVSQRLDGGGAIEPETHDDQPPTRDVGGCGQRPRGASFSDALQHQAKEDCGAVVVVTVIQRCQVSSNIYSQCSERRYDHLSKMNGMEVDAGWEQTVWCDERA